MIFVNVYNFQIRSQKRIRKEFQSIALDILFLKIHYWKMTVMWDYFERFLQPLPKLLPVASFTRNNVGKLFMGHTEPVLGEVH